MDIKDIMKTPVITISDTSTIREAIAMLSSRGVSGLPVVDSDGKMVGIVTEHDVIKAILPTYQDIAVGDAALLDRTLLEDRMYAVRDNPVTGIMIPNVVSLTENDSVLKAASTIVLRKVKRIPVVRDGRPVGIVSRIDIVEAVLEGE